MAAIRAGLLPYFCVTEIVDLASGVTLKCLRSVYTVVIPPFSPSFTYVCITYHFLTPVLYKLVIHKLS